MNRSSCFAVGVTIVALLLTGCDGKEAKAPVLVGMADLDRVADEIGVNAKYQEYVLGYRDRLRKTLEETLLPMQQDVERLQRELRDELDAIPQDERKKPDWKAPASIEALYRRLIDKQQQMQAERQASDTRLQEYDRKMKQDFLTAIQPAMSEICREKGVRVLVPRGANLYCEPDSDLTAALIAHLKAHPIPPPAPPPGDS